MRISMINMFKFSFLLNLPDIKSVNSESKYLKLCKLNLNFYPNFHFNIDKILKMNNQRLLKSICIYISLKYLK